VAAGPGGDDLGVDVPRNIADMDRIIARLDSGATSAVVLGGSYIGLELTEAFRTRGLRTPVIERTGQIMPWLDPEMTGIRAYHVDTYQRTPLAVGQGAMPMVTPCRGPAR
jgi:NADPH-dependent 2,4-dienoyl-CoA reductase/sulfur reductase-like enzyme